MIGKTSGRNVGLGRFRYGKRIETLHIRFSFIAVSVWDGSAMGSGLKPSFGGPYDLLFVWDGSAMGSGLKPHLENPLPSFAQMFGTVPLWEAD